MRREILILLLFAIFFVPYDEVVIEYDYLAVQGHLELRNVTVKTDRIEIYPSGKLMLIDVKLIPKGKEISIKNNGTLKIRGGSVDVGTGLIWSFGGSELECIDTKIRGKFNLSGVLILSGTVLNAEGSPFIIYNSNALTMRDVFINGYAQHGLILYNISNCIIKGIKINFPSEYGMAFENGIIIEKCKNVKVESISAQNVETFIHVINSSDVYIGNVDVYSFNNGILIEGSIVNLNNFAMTGGTAGIIAHNSTCYMHSIFANYLCSIINGSEHSYIVVDTLVGENIPVPFILDPSVIFTSNNIFIDKSETKVVLNAHTDIEFLNAISIFVANSNLTITNSKINDFWALNSNVICGNVEFGDVAVNFSYFMCNNIRIAGRSQFYDAKVILRNIDISGKNALFLSRMSNLTLINCHIDTTAGVILEKSHIYAEGLYIKENVPIILIDPPDFPVLREFNYGENSSSYTNYEGIVSSRVIFAENSVIFLEKIHVHLLVAKNSLITLDHCDLNNSNTVIFCWNSSITLKNCNIEAGTLIKTSDADILLKNCNIKSQVFIDGDCKCQENTSISISITHSRISTLEGIILKNAKNVSILMDSSKIEALMRSYIPFFLALDTTTYSVTLKNTTFDLGAKPLGARNLLGGAHLISLNSTVNGKPILCIHADSVYENMEVGGIFVMSCPINVVMKNVTAWSGVNFLGGTLIFLENLNFHGPIILNQTNISIAGSFLSHVPSVIMEKSIVNLSHTVLEKMYIDEYSIIHGYNLTSISGEELEILCDYIGSYAKSVGGLIILNSSLSIYGHPKWLV
ncbi:MAG: hypothetical protein QXL15_01405, partial [Candidatus Korarchaeota archaeon]